MVEVSPNGEPPRKKNAFKFLNDLLQQLPRIDNPIDRRLILQDYYESYFRIFNHLDPNAKKYRPLASVEMHPCENYTEASPMYDKLEEYSSNPMYKDVWGLNLYEFLQLPRYYTQMIRDFTLKAAKRRSETTSDAFQAALNKPLG